MRAANVSEYSPAPSRLRAATENVCSVPGMRPVRMYCGEIVCGSSTGVAPSSTTTWYASMSTRWSNGGSHSTWSDLLAERPT